MAANGMKCRLIRDMPMHPGIKARGTVIDHPDSWKLVRFGVAEPADDECDAKADRTPEQIQTALRAYERVERGIHPDDYEAYNSGVMVGYNPDGSWKPGPRFGDYEWEERKQNSPLIIDD